MSFSVSARRVIRRARFCLGLLWWGIGTYFATLVVLFGLTGLLIDVAVMAGAHRPRFSLPALYWLEHQSWPDLASRVVSLMTRLDRTFRFVACGMAAGVVGQKAWRARQAAIASGASAASSLARPAA
ncbi:hypothetical protein K2X14_14485 [Acetobacter sp. TBRC 12305]|uniref:Uncharacterized protein n=1 Tax=Acetobacter garciniae TaxID=2817435 RepID=A0A939HND4_9PROT|nr:hypothetical protein [Acetobacter garciniae]MBO1326220.1 hypothetical protein [Acetobacter garciniae]MBX0346043.1 hypothetical protein [Acetobacter garciniae]